MTRIGVIFTPDNADDADFWRYVPAGSSLHFTRTPLDLMDDGPEGETWSPTDAELVQATRTFLMISPAVTTLACTSGSFANGLEDERRIRATMTGAGAKIALTTSGSVLDALAATGARRVAVGTPYDAATTARLGSFLTAAGYDVRSLVNHEPATPEELSDMTEAELTRLAADADRPEADVLFISCAALETYDLIPRLEATHGKTVITSAQVTMWAALGAAGVVTEAIPQSLFGHAWRQSPARAA